MGRTSVRYEKGMRFVGRVKSGHDVPMDASAEGGGQDGAARPVELLLCALGGCTGMDVVSILRKMRTEPASLEIDVEDDRREDHPKAIRGVHLVYRVTGALPEENLRKAIELSLSKYCSVANSLECGPRITWEVQIAPD